MCVHDVCLWGVCVCVGEENLTISIHPASVVLTLNSAKCSFDREIKLFNFHH